MSQNRTVYDLVPDLRRLRDDVLYGDVWEQANLTKRDRSFITCAILAALYRTDELKAHLQLALQNGVTEDELKGLTTQVAFYGGWPCAMNTGRVLLDVLGDS